MRRSKRSRPVNEIEPGGADGSDTAIDTEDVHTIGAARNQREPAEVVAIDNTWPATAESGRQVQDKPTEGAMRHSDRLRT